MLFLIDLPHILEIIVGFSKKSEVWIITFKVMLNLLVFSLLSSAFAANWAVLVAGSGGMINYRHQSDVFRTYKILTKNGFDPSKIIVMAYDDVAHHRGNPFPEQIFNVPDGPDVYIGADNIDYKAENVTVSKFVAVMTGNATAAGGKVLESTSSDNVFLLFSDHGSTGLISFPTGPDMYVDELQDMFSEMYNKSMYNKMLVYMETCYAGSMFKDIMPTNMSIYIATASDYNESSYAMYCGIRKYKVCLSNEFTQGWMEQSDTGNMSEITVGNQFEVAKNFTLSSYPQEYGDTTLKTDFIAEYQSGPILPPELKTIHQMITPPIRRREGGKRVRQEDAYLSYLETAAAEDPFGEEAVEYHKQILIKKKEEARRDAIASFFGMIFPDPNYATTATSIDFKLFRRAVTTYQSICGRLNEFSYWSITRILSRAVADKKLTSENFSAFESLLRQLA
ncbi:putative Peptidase C13 family protein [Monocercomonoides exilis]|uniref:putative Peptidase C13 family protein n=1 Tax=Monocercomonoides exilis TaxID=2049356 RepID=UPI0035596F77|nr:putative Peptidase C13 family protein [Monocercomonoides exilis]|eukprot:MONOS_4026.1-p1 / transcript=MONOS_4026.1 / gene=MONOS_4026 / organism=Monocercomonoides_exilis_PA203 / gene_product=Peptidase C13 family protein / transcript_product=Peptidase C13 family protein / location=Mono_scaffold00102:22985-24465(-) / protein_length=450 / sequence_SO=supercontig / SO=protein_coding / is_pseudo=false